VLGLFAKWPVAGNVKTRLAGNDGAWGARVARAFLQDTIDRLAAVAARRSLTYAPRGAEEQFRDLVGGRFELMPQAPGDLGQRLAHFVADRQSEGATAVVVVGTDSPTLPVALVEQAFVELQTADVVLGPTFDGGYYLVGCGRYLPPIFDHVDWSSAAVLRQTVAALTDPQWRLALLPPWYDVDTPQDWEMLRGHLAAMRRAGIDPEVPCTEALCREPPP
jgi:rSAM/selenodomain-associated transferase 1